MCKRFFILFYKIKQEKFSFKKYLFKDELIVSASLDGSFKIVNYKSMKTNASFGLTFEKSEYDIEHVREFNEAITYSFNNEHK